MTAERCKFYVYFTTVFGGPNLFSDIETLIALNGDHVTLVIAIHSSKIHQKELLENIKPKLPTPSKMKNNSERWDFWHQLNKLHILFGS